MQVEGSNHPFQVMPRNQPTRTGIRNKMVEFCNCCPDQNHFCGMTGAGNIAKDWTAQWKWGNSWYFFFLKIFFTWDCQRSKQRKVLMAWEEAKLRQGIYILNTIHLFHLPGYHWVVSNCWQIRNSAAINILVNVFGYMHMPVLFECICRNSDSAFLHSADSTVYWYSSQIMLIKLSDILLCVCVCLLCKLLLAVC